MNPDHKKALRAISLELRHTLEGTYDGRGDFLPGDLERRLNAIGVWRDRPAKPLNELTHLPAEDKDGRQIIDAYLQFRAEAGVGQAEAVAEFVRESAYHWANRLLTLRCMEARGIIDEVILQKEIYGRRSMLHNRLGQQNPALLAQPDEGLFTVLLAEFGTRAQELPALFNPKAPAIALRPSLAALKKCIGLLSGTVKAGSYVADGDELFAAPDALGWAYQYWNAEEKDRVFEKVRTEKGAKIAGADIIPATQLYTEPYMVKFLVQNSLGALWMGMHPDSDLADGWEYYVRDADRPPVEQKAVRDITFLDPACGSGHFHLEAFDLLYQMYEAETTHAPHATRYAPEEICAAILNHNLYGIDIDERAIQIAQAALWMKAKELAWELQPEALTSFHHHFVATNIRLPRGKDHLQAFLQKHPEDRPLRPALETVFEGLENAHELGSLLQLEEPVEKELRYLQGKQAEAVQTLRQGELFTELAKPRQGELPLGVESYDAWKTKTLAQLQAHFEAEAEAADLTQAFFGQSAGKGLALFDILARRYDVVTANPPYMGVANMGDSVKNYVTNQYPLGWGDLYTAFILRCRGLCLSEGLVGMITLNSWMFLSSFIDLRKLLLTENSLHLMSQLGRHAFSEADPPGHAVLFITSSSNSQNGLINATRFTEPLPPEIQARLLSCLVRVMNGKNVASSDYTEEFLLTKIHRTNCQDLLSLPDSTISFWLPDSVKKLFKGQNIGDILTVVNRTKTGQNDRFVRYIWEIQSVIGPDGKWLIYQKGGDYRTYSGNNINIIRWESYYKDYYRRDPNCRITDDEFTCRDALTYTSMGRQFCGRIAPPISTYDVGGAALVGDHDDLFLALAILNTPFGSYVIKAINASINIQSSDVVSVPIPTNTPPEQLRPIIDAAKSAFSIRRQLSSSDLLEYDFEQPLSVNKQLGLEKQLVLVKDQIATLIYGVFGITKNDFFFQLPYETRLEEIESGNNGTLQSQMELDYQADCLTVNVLRLLGHRWPKQIEANEPVPDWAEPSGIIPITGGFLHQRVGQASLLAQNGQAGSSSYNLEREFAEIVGEKLADWLAGSFFTRHISQFKKRPIAWQLQTRPVPGQKRRGGPAFAALLYYHKLSADLLPSLRNQFVRDLIRAYETEQRTLRQSENLSSGQETRLHQLESWLTELSAFSDALQRVSEQGFGDTPALQASLRQYALDDALQSLKAVWLGRLADKAASDALPDWQARADKSHIHPALRDWIATAIANLPHHCAQVGPPAPRAAKLPTDPDARALAVIIGSQAKEMVTQSLKLAGDVWFSELNEHVLQPLLDEINELKAQQTALEAERDTLDPQGTRGQYNAEQAIKSIKAQIKQKTNERNAHRKAANELREHMESWLCPQSAGWTDWLGQQPLFDQIASLDGQRQPPQTIAEFIAQESRYIPDINDGVRVNIAPLQKAGLLAADVLAAKELDKAIADRAEWRADERRWCREGKLPRPGWWA